MKKSEKRQKMIAIFAGMGFLGSYIREAIDKSLALDDPKFELIDEIKKEMKAWYGFELTDDQIKNYIEYLREDEGINLLWFDTSEREEYGSYISRQLIGMDWPMNSSPKEYKETFYKTLKEQAPLYGYKWLSE